MKIKNTVSVVFILLFGKLSGESKKRERLKTHNATLWHTEGKKIIGNSFFSLNIVFYSTKITFLSEISSKYGIF